MPKAKSASDSLPKTPKKRKRVLDALLEIHAYWMLRFHGYKVPRWCGMPSYIHADGMGGCWGVSGGYVKKQGEAYCNECEFKIRRVKA